MIIFGMVTAVSVGIGYPETTVSLARYVGDNVNLVLVSFRARERQSRVLNLESPIRDTKGEALG